MMEPSDLPPLVNRQDGASLLPEPELPLRAKAADLAASELDRMERAKISAGCYLPPPLRRPVRPVNTPGA